MSQVVWLGWDRLEGYGSGHTLSIKLSTTLHLVKGIHIDMSDK